MVREAKKAVPVTAPKENEDWLDSAKEEVKEVAKEVVNEVVHNVEQGGVKLLTVLSQRKGPIGVRGPDGNIVDLTYNNPVKLTVEEARKILAMFPEFIKIL
jgi:hypothetical protein